MKKQSKKILIQACGFMMTLSLFGGSFLTSYADAKNVDPASGEQRPKFNNITNSVEFGDFNEKLLNKDVLTTAKELNITGDIEVIVDLGGSGLYDIYDGEEEFSEFSKSATAQNYVEELTKNQKAVLKELKRKNVEYKYRGNFTAVNNGFGINLKVADLKKLEEIEAVKSIYISQTYDLPQTIAVENHANVYDSGVCNASELIERGYAGQGTVVAILDTGLDYTHPAFQQVIDTTVEGAWDKNYVASKMAVNSGIEQLRSNYDGFTVDDVYISTKVPYAYDYADDDANVYPSYSHHGTHVAGIVAGYDEGKTINDKGDTFSGVAPQAQLMICKVFGDDLDNESVGGAITVNILRALNDCVTFGVDVINMSLGSAAGFTTTDHDEYLNATYERVRESGVSLLVAAGNENSSGFGGGNGTNLASNPDSATVGSPSTYAPALSVASIAGKLSPYMMANPGSDNETAAFITEANDGKGNAKEFINELFAKAEANEYEFNADGSLTMQYVVIGGVGRSANYSSTIKRTMERTPTIALVKRGDTTFAEKIQAAMDAGAFACIIYNNVSGTIRMSLGEVEDPVPCCSIGMDAGNKMVAGATKNIGSITISRAYEAGPFMSDFSSWGPTPELKFKPEITAYGGEILSAVPGGYEELSGTSMATPNLAGSYAILRQYLKKNTTLTGTDLNARMNQLAMSTTTMVLNEEGNPYSPRKQGAGLADVIKAVDTDAYITVKKADGTVSDKTKIELSDDKNRTGVYEFSFDIVNQSNKTLNFNPKSYVFTETLASDLKTVAEKAHMLEDTVIEYKVNGTKATGSIAVSANSSVEVTVKLSLGTEGRKYIEESFVNGMFVEGFIRFAQEGTENEIGIPFMGFYGNWVDSPLFDYTLYDISASENDSSVDFENKLKATTRATTLFGKYKDDYMLPLGMYLYAMADEDVAINTTEEKAAISTFNTDLTSQASIWSLEMVYAGLLRGAKVVETNVVDTKTGEVIFSRTDYNLRKAYSGGGRNIGAPISLEFKPYEWGLKNNTVYKLSVKGYIEDTDGTLVEPKNNEYTSLFTVDYEAPVIEDYSIRFEEYKTESNEVKYRIWMDVIVSDNHYVQDIIPCFKRLERNMNTLFLLTEHAIPVYGTERGASNKVTFEITDFYEDYFLKDDFCLYVEDYAMNRTAVEILHDTTLDYPSALTFQTDNKLTVKEENVTDTVKINGVNTQYTYNVYGLTMTAGELYTLNMVSPDGQTHDLIWDISNENKIKMGKSNQLYTAEDFSASDGVVDILIKANGKILAKIDVTYTEDGTKASKILNSISFNPAGEAGGTMIDINSTGLLELRPNDVRKLSVVTDPWYVPGVNYEWTSTDPSVVSVDQEGNIKALKQGNATITVVAVGYARIQKSVNVKVGSIFAYSSSTLNGYYGPSDVVFPEDLNIYYLNKDCFKNNTEITSIVLPKNLQEIPEMAFYGCTSLRSVTINGAVTTVNYAAFANCSSLEEIILEDKRDEKGEYLGIGQLSVARHAFANCTSLKRIVNIERLTTIYQAAFMNCTSLESIDLTNVIVSGDAAFYGCENLENVTFGPYTAIGQFMFQGSKIQNVDWYGSVIPANGFSGCEQLQSITFHNAVESIGANAFYNTALQSITLPDCEIKLGTQAFNSCKNLTTLNLQANTKLNLAGNPFLGCTAFSTITVDSANPYYTVVNNVLYSKDMTELVLVPATVTSYTLPSTVTKIGKNAFANTKIFNGDASTVVSVDDKCKEYAFSASNVTSVTIPSTMKKVPEGMFMNCTELTTVVISEGVEEISDFAFYGCTALTNVTLPTTLKTIGNYAFTECANIVNLEDEQLVNVESVGDYAFKGCTALRQFNAPKTTKLGISAFGNCTSLLYATFGGVTEMGANLFFYATSDGTSASYYPCLKLKTVTFGEGTTKISAFALINPYGSTDALTTVNLPGTVTEIDEYAFYGRTALKTINLNGVKTIGNYAFYACLSVKNLNFATVEEIGDYAFVNTQLLTNAVLTKATTIGDYAFADSGLTSVSIPALKIIGDYAFENTKLTTITIPKTFNAHRFEDNWYEIDNGGDEQLVTGKKSPNYGYGAFAKISTLNEIKVESGNELFQVIDGALYMQVENGLVLMQYPVARTNNSFKVADNTIRIGDSAFAGAKALKSVTFPYTVVSIGSNAFFDTNAKTYTFEGTEAPVLESTCIPFSSAEVRNDETLSIIFGVPLTTDLVQNKIASTMYYGNFVDYIAKEVEAKNLIVAGNTGYVATQFDFTLNIPENATGFDGFVWKSYFTNVNYTEYSATTLTKNTIIAIDAIPENITELVNAKSTTAEKLEFLNGITTEYLQVARKLYNQVSNDEKQLAFVSNSAKLATAEATVRELKAGLGAEAKVTELVIVTRPNQKYVEGDTFDVSGMVIKAVYDDESEKILSVGEYEIDKTVLKYGDDEVTFTYNGVSTTLLIGVEKDPNKPDTDSSSSSSEEKSMPKTWVPVVATVSAVVVLAGAGVAVFFVLRKKKQN